MSALTIGEGSVHRRLPWKSPDTHPADRTGSESAKVAQQCCGGKLFERPCCLRRGPFSQPMLRVLVKPCLWKGMRHMFAQLVAAGKLTASTWINPRAFILGKVSR